jgi:CMP-N,N'-diacetyllegionaminic acid synthase
MKTVALILARGGSKGIPNKNIQLLNGEPLISYTINAAKYSDVDEVWVSTDSVNIKTLAKKFGAKVIDRPSEFAKDNSPNEQSLLHFAENEKFDVLVSIQPTSPLLSPKYINQGLEKIKDGYDSSFSAYREHWFPRWTLGVEPIGFKNESRPRRQDRNECYVENGAFYATTKTSLLTSKYRVSGKIAVVEMPFSDSIQIDTYEDLNLVERLL